MARAVGRRVRPISVLVAAALLMTIPGAAAAAGAPSTAGPRPALATIMSEDFEGAFPGTGWVVSGTYFWAPRDCKPHNGTYSAWAIGGSGGSGFSCGGYYPNNLNSWMTYGPIDLTSYADAELEFWYWVNSEPAYDYFRAFVSADGSYWTNVANVSGSSGGWQQAIVDMATWVGDDSVWLRFAFDTDQQTTYSEGAYVDDIAVRGRPLSKARLRSVAANDGWVRESTENSSVGGTLDATGACRAGDDGGDRQYRSILDFNTGILPDNAVITSATLDIKMSSLVGDNWSSTHGALQADIRTGSFNKVPTLEAVDFQAPATLNAFGAFALVTGTPWFRVTLNAAALAKINLTGRTQFRLSYAIGDDDDGAADYLAFFCGDALRARSRPVLRILYYVP